MKKVLKKVIGLVLALMALCVICLPVLADGAPEDGSAGGLDLTEIVRAVIALVSAVITAYLVPWIKSRTTAQQQTYLRAMVSTAVHAAEQIYGAGGGADKLEYAECWLADRKIKLDTEQVRAMIEAEVYKMQYDHGYIIEAGETEEAKE